MQISNILEITILGLFHRAIMQSGTAYATWALNGRRRYVDGSKDIALKFGCTTEQHWKQKDFVDLLNCLQKLDSSLLLAATAVKLRKFQKSSAQISTNFLFVISTIGL